MPIYAYRCEHCNAETEEVRMLSEVYDRGPRCPCSDGAVMTRVPSAASFGFKTKGGNFASFSGAHGPVTKGNRRPKTIRKGQGLGGHRKFDKSRVQINPIPEGKP